MGVGWKIITDCDNTRKKRGSLIVGRLIFDKKKYSVDINCSSDC